MRVLRVNQIKLPVIHTKEDLDRQICKSLRLMHVPEYSIVRKSIDARKKDRLLYVYSVDIKNYLELPYKRILEKNKQTAIVDLEPYSFFDQKQIRLKYSPVIIGTGPAGLFCGLALAKVGLKPILIERGMQIEKRKSEVKRYLETGRFNPDSNIQFGEGGAGTFSDGKLNSSIHDKTGRVDAVLRIFAEYGAPEEILYSAKPHIGTDKLCSVIENMRNAILSFGGQILFETKLSDIETGEQSGIHTLILKTDDAKSSTILKEIGTEKEENVFGLDTDRLILAIGHSARDTFQMLYRRKFALEPKPFAVGLRIQHPEEQIRASQYGTSEEAKTLPAADYKLTHQTEDGRAVYSFCMCPGGSVINASSEEGGITVNGMSNHARDGKCSNSAIVVNITPEDYLDIRSTGMDHIPLDEKEAEEMPEVLRGVFFQRRLERAAYRIGNGNIPVQLFRDFQNGKISESFEGFSPDFQGKTSFANLADCLPTYVKNAIIGGISEFGKRINGFDRDDAVLAGVESRTSSPVRILRNEDLESKISGIYPCGEGAGYAGGITSAAVDGLRVAESVVNSYENR